MLRARVRAAGLSAERITGHSSRDGHATAAGLAGASLDRIAAQMSVVKIFGPTCRHHTHPDPAPTPLTLIERYIRPMEALRLTSSRDLGL